MEKSKVYFTDFRVKVGVSLLQKLKTLCTAAGIMFPLALNEQAQKLFAFRQAA